MLKKLNIAFIEPYYAESHKTWLDELIRNSSHVIKKFTLPGRFWKWRMHGGAITLAEMLIRSGFNPDLILSSDMLDLNTFLSLTRRKFPQVPSGLYFHENQLSYPWSPQDQDVKFMRNLHYGYINYTSALAADAVFFNSNYHQKSFFKGLSEMLKNFPDYQNIASIDAILSKSKVLPLGMSLQKIKNKKLKSEIESPVILWNHRWEYDKNPELFFNTLIRLSEKKIPFHLIVTGKQYLRKPEIFDKAFRELKAVTMHWGYVSSRNAYFNLLYNSDILPVTSNQDFFGMAVIEAIKAGVYPLLPHRLAYPEHNIGENYYYPTDDAFEERLQKVILEKRYLMDKPEMQTINSYDWDQIIIKYDNLFFEVVDKK